MPLLDQNPDIEERYNTALGFDARIVRSDLASPDQVFSLEVSRRPRAASSHVHLILELFKTP